MKFYLTISLIILQLFCWKNYLEAQSVIPTNEDFIISIVPKKDNGTLTVVGNIENLTKNQFDLKYRLSVIKKKKNYSRSRQTNKFTLNPLSKIEVGKVMVGYTTESIFDIQLEIFSDTTLISFLEISNELDKGIIGTGLVIDNTRTKNGRDFYRFFNKHWLAADLKTDAMIKIEEKPGRSRSTLILVHVNNQLIIRRMLQNRYDKIKGQSQWAFDVTLDYFKNNPNVNKPSDEHDLLGNGLN